MPADPPTCLSISSPCQVQSEPALALVHIGDADHQQHHHVVVILTGAALIREREHGTIEHLLPMPVTPNHVMLAKIWANGVIIVLAAVLSMKVMVQVVLQVPIAGSLWLFLAGTLLYHSP